VVTAAMANETMRAVRFERYGETDVLQVVAVPRPRAAAGRAVVQVQAAAINPGEASIRKGLLHDRWPATFPEGEGTDFAGIVTEVCVAFPALSALEAGYEVFVVTDASTGKPISIVTVVVTARRLVLGAAANVSGDEAIKLVKSVDCSKVAAAR